jgi:hypothetical protein
MLGLLTGGFVLGVVCAWIVERTNWLYGMLWGTVRKDM